MGQLPRALSTVCQQLPSRTGVSVHGHVCLRGEGQGFMMLSGAGRGSWAREQRGQVQGCSELGCPIHLQLL